MQPRQVVRPRASPSRKWKMGGGTVSAEESLSKAITDKTAADAALTKAKEEQAAADAALAKAKEE